MQSSSATQGWLSATPFETPLALQGHFGPTGRRSSEAAAKGGAGFGFVFFWYCLTMLLVVLHVVFAVPLQC